ncbi:phenylacetate--CoA ligase family protein [Flavicella marina]|uniref:phenylacetate--CoA ligase family protein n=1 Tax=Flavicella marina TaxID=1475951 RepID=UPI001263F9AF|nr:phenylacetate--CoA ligase family protein [Flavicella marina]
MYTIFLEKIILPIGDWLNGGSFVKKLKYWRQIDLLDEEDLEILQADNLKLLLKHAIDKTKFYQNIEFKGNSPNEWLQNFPILSKNDLRERTDQLLATSKKELTKISSSGSSGISSSVYMDKNDLASLRAGLVHWWEWSGYKMGCKVVQTGISPNRGLLKNIKDFLFQTIYVNAFSHDEAQIISVLNKIKQKNYILIGYASSLNVFAEVALKHNFKIRLKACISLGDKLFDHYRKNISNTFHCTIQDTYGSAEGFLISSQLDLDYSYILSPQVYVEILDDDNNAVPDGELGHVVVTRLDGFAMPLIRYKIGDLAIKLPKEKYPKNRKFQYPLLQKVIGRDTDIVKTNNGKTLVVHSFTGIFEYIPEIKQFKIIQNSIEGIEILIVKGEDFSDGVVEETRKKISVLIGSEDFSINFEIVQKIEPTKSGKPQIIESNLNEKK